MVSFILPGNSATGGYNVANSLRFDDGNPDSLNKTIGTSTNTKIWTCSFWWKAGQGGSQQQIFSVTNGNSDSTFFQIQYRDNQEIRLNGYNTTWLTTNRKFRDYSAWYSVVVVADSTQGTASNRLKLYINGTEETSFATDNRSSISLNQTWGINLSSQPHYIGSEGGTGSGVSGYLSEFVFIDGQALDPTSFGEFDEDSPTIWKPIDVSGLTFGTNGFYLDFENASSLGADVSGNGNNFSVNNLTSIDQSTDTCTNNFATLNPLDKGYTGTINLSEGNLVTESSSGAGDYGLRSTIGVSQGKWYFECKTVSSNTIGILKMNDRLEFSMMDNSPNTDVYGIQRYNDSKTNLYNNGTFVSQNTAMWGGFSSSNVISVALDLDNGKIFFAKDGDFKDTSGNTGDPANGTNPTLTISSYTADVDFWGFYTELRGNDADGIQVNFGNSPFTISSGNSDANGYGNFEYSVPSGYYALNSKNLAEFG
jgi:hypothetical protein